jgi:YebC/PmpR family DNA-binding regulatory protein
MGRIFEKRKHKMFARYAKMAKAFTRIGREISIAVKSGGPDPNYNPKLRLVIQNSKALNMPKERVDAAIKRAVSKDEKDYEEVVYEGYGPYGVAILIETATDNPTRTVANIRSYFNKGNGSLGKTGSLDFIFERKGIFKINAGNMNQEDLELELIDFGAEEIEIDENFFIVTTNFEDFGKMQKALEDRNIEVVQAELTRLPLSTADVTDEQRSEIEAMIERFEEDDDIQNVFHNMAE